LHRVTHVISAARSGQGVVDDITSIQNSGTACMAQATENDVGLPQPVSPPTAPSADGHASSL